mmetsp:Transcript_5644/g.13267  ORF Transcript_5644/g.13267 Transcript_5644/m.13267 type:complete len:463 (-) Transcript_5644:91-1479(-)
MTRAYLTKTFEEEKQRYIETATYLKNNDKSKNFAMFGDFRHQVFNASGELLRDRDCAMAAVTVNGGLLMYFDKTLRAIPEIVAMAARTSSEGIQYASSTLMSNKDFVLGIFQDPEGTSDAKHIFEHLRPDLRDDRDIALAAVKRNGLALQFATDGIKDDREVVLEAVKNTSRALEFGSERLRADVDVVLEAVGKLGVVLKFASEDLRAEKAVVLAAVKNKGVALKFASEELRADQEVVLAALSENGSALQHASSTFKSDVNFVRVAIKSNYLASTHVSEELKYDKDLIVLGVRYADTDNMVQTFYAKAPPAMQEATPWSTIKQVSCSTMAVPGEDAPIVSIKLLLQTNNDRPTKEARVSEQHQVGADDAADEKPYIFECTVTLMSGNDFKCYIPDLPSTDLWEQERPGPILNNLAETIVRELPKHVEGSDAKRVFMFAMTDGDSESTPLSPWDWDKPLSDFL